MNKKRIKTLKHRYMISINYSIIHKKDIVNSKIEEL